MGSVVGVDACTWRSHVTGGRNLIPTEHGRWQKGEPMEKVKNYKYLGVTLTRDLTWSDHIRNITAKSRKLVWLLAIYMHRQFYKCSNPATLSRLSVSLMIPHLEHNASA